MIQKGFKRGIAMIELIFALVIIAIVLLSSPMLINQSMSSSFVALQQEAIAATASQVSMLLSKPWDEEDTNGDAPIISLGNPNNSPFNNSFNGIKDSTNTRTSERGGVPVPPAPIGKDVNETEANATLSFDDIDDYNGFNMGISVFVNNSNVAETTSADIGDYVDVNLSISNSITFADDAPNGDIAWNVTAGTINAGNTIFTTQNLGTSGGATIESQIKFVRVNLTSDNPSDTSELNKSITLNAFSCNLGSYSVGSAPHSP